MGVLVVTLELVFASKTNLVVSAVEYGALEILGLDAVLGRVVTFEVAKAFSDESAAGLTASPISRLAVMVR